MNNLLSYCGLIDAKIRASDKDLPVYRTRLAGVQFQKKPNHFLQVKRSPDARQIVSETSVWQDYQGGTM